MHPLQFNFHGTSGELCTRVPTLVARIEILGGREVRPLAGDGCALELFPDRPLMLRGCADTLNALDLSGCGGRQIGWIEIWSTGRVKLDCRYELSRDDLKQVLGAVKRASERIKRQTVSSIPLLDDAELSADCLKKSLEELKVLLAEEEFKKIALEHQRRIFLIRQGFALEHIDALALRSFLEGILFSDPSCVCRLGLLDAIREWADLQHVDFTSCDASMFLTIAIEFGDRRTVEKMVARGMSVQEDLRDLFSPLAYAIFCQKFSIAQFLLSKGATLKEDERAAGFFISLLDISRVGHLRKDEEGRLGVALKMVLDGSQLSK